MFYHVSKYDLGDSITLEPRVPKNSLIDEEGDIPRVCVSTHIFYCLRSIICVAPKDFHVFNLIEAFRQNHIPMEGREAWVARGENLKSPAVYASQTQAYVPPNCSDFRQNKEHWYLQATTFEKQGFLDLTHLVATGELRLVNTFHELAGKHILDEQLKQVKIRK